VYVPVGGVEDAGARGPVGRGDGEAQGATIPTSSIGARASR
jgi:hypothetical protein